MTVKYSRKSLNGRGRRSAVTGFAMLSAPSTGLHWVQVVQAVQIVQTVDRFGNRFERLERFELFERRVFCFSTVLKS
jgi:hypothetical protein